MTTLSAMEMNNHDTQNTFTSGGNTFADFFSGTALVKYSLIEELCNIKDFKIWSSLIT